MSQGEFLQTGEFAIGERPCATWMVGAVSASSDTIGHPIAGGGCFQEFICAFNVVVGPGGRDRVNGFVDGCPWLETSSGGVLGMGRRWEGWENLARAENMD